MIKIKNEDLIITDWTVHTYVFEGWDSARKSLFNENKYYSISVKRPMIAPIHGKQDLNSPKYSSTYMISFDSVELENLYYLFYGTYSNFPSFSSLENGMQHVDEFLDKIKKLKIFI